MLHIPNGDLHDAAVYEKAVAEAGKFGHTFKLAGLKSEKHTKKWEAITKITKKSIKIHQQTEESAIRQMKDLLTCWDVKKGQVVFKARPLRRFEDEELTTYTDPSS